MNHCHRGRIVLEYLNTGDVVLQVIHPNMTRKQWVGRTCGKIGGNGCANGACFIYQISQRCIVVMDVDSCETAHVNHSASSQSWTRGNLARCSAFQGVPRRLGVIGSAIIGSIVMPLSQLGHRLCEPPLNTCRPRQYHQTRPVTFHIVNWSTVSIDSVLAC
jgi:hypothetical protein